MDSILTDSLCIIGALYLILHVRHSISSLREGVARPVASPTQALQESKPHIWDPQDRPAVGAAASTRTAPSHSRSQ